MAKPSPWLPPDRLRMKVLIPTTSPSAFTRGPPLLPGLIGASVWMKSMGASISVWRAVALMMPKVTVLARPCGLPMAKTSSPCFTAALSRRVSAGSPMASILRTARSDSLCVPTTRAS